MKAGVLQTWLMTSYSARKLGMKSTGHAGGIHNWRIAGQGLDFNGMLKQMGKGLLVTELMGQGVSGVTGIIPVGHQASGSKTAKFSIRSVRLRSRVT